MKNKYLVVAVLLMFLGIIQVQALTVGDCKVLASFKLSSSLDEEKYICKGTQFGQSNEAIYYSGEGNTIVMNNLEAYYFTNWDEYDVTIDINGNNNISLLHLSDSKFKVSGSGSLKFKQNSFVKKVVNGESVYQYLYRGKTVLNSDKKIYEGTTLEFEENYELLSTVNELPSEYNIGDYELVQVVDYLKMTSVVVTDSWLSQHIDTDLKAYVADGFGIIEYVKSVPEEKKVETKDTEDNKLETDNVILISEKKLNKKYKLKEEDLREKEVATKVAESITDKDLVSFYDVSVYNGKKEVSMKNGKYIIKIKIEDRKEKYENYQIIYVNNEGEIEEYLDGTIEGDYVVFETTHLSQYGVIANPVVEDISLDINTDININKSDVNFGNIFKISILLFIIVVTVALITFILLKSDLLKTKKKAKRKRA